MIFAALFPTAFITSTNTCLLYTSHGLLDKRQELSDQIEQMEQEKTAIEQQVKLQMQDAAYGTCLLYTSPGLRQLLSVPCAYRTSGCRSGCYQKSQKVRLLHEDALIMQNMGR